MLESFRRKFQKKVPNPELDALEGARIDSATAPIRSNDWEAAARILAAKTGDKRHVAVSQNDAATCLAIEASNPALGSHARYDVVAEEIFGSEARQHYNQLRADYKAKQTTRVMAVGLMKKKYHAE